jgi:hypothetical protein
MLHGYELERHKCLFGLEPKKNAFMKEFKSSEKDYEKELNSWNDKINECIKIWKESLGDSVLKQIQAELNGRNMPAVLTRLDELYSGVVVGDLQSAVQNELSKGIAYDPKE